MSSSNVFYSAFGKNLPAYAEVLHRKSKRGGQKGDLKLTDMSLRKHYIHNALRDAWKDSHIKLEEAISQTSATVVTPEAKETSARPQKKRIRSDEDDDQETFSVKSYAVDPSFLRCYTLADIFAAEKDCRLVVLVRKDSHLDTKVQGEIDSALQCTAYLQEGNTHHTFTALHVVAGGVMGTTMDKLCNNMAEASSVIENHTKAVAHFTLQSAPSISIKIDLPSIILGDDVQIWGCLGDRTDRFKGYLTKLGYGADDPTRNVIVANLLRELRGDSIQMFELISATYEIFILQRDKRMANLTDAYQKLRAETQELADEEEKRRIFLNIVDKEFEDSLILSFNTFVDIRAPLVPVENIATLLKTFKIFIPRTYESEMDRCVSRKSKSDPRRQLQAMFNFLGACKQKSKNVLPYCTAVFRMALEARGEKGKAGKLLQKFGLVSSKAHMEAILKNVARRMKSTHAEIVGQLPYVVMAFDNSLKLRNLKSQKGGKKSDSQLGTCRIIIEPRMPVAKESFWYPVNEGPPDSIPVLDQLIPAPPGMLPFEDFDTNDNQFLANMFKVVGESVVHKSEITQEMIYGKPSPDDMEQSFSFSWDKMEPTDGRRTASYFEFLEMAWIGKSMKRHISGPKAAEQMGFSAEDKHALAVFNAAHKDRDLLLSMTRFQEGVVRAWNPHFDEVTKIMFPPMSEYPENTIVGCGAVFLELAMDAGLIVPTNDPECPLALQENYEDRRFIVAGDCLSIDFLASFQRKIDEACKDSHKARFETKKVFAAATEQALSKPGNWHLELHMLCVIMLLGYGTLFQAFQKVIQFRGVRKDPSERFQLTVDFLEIILGPIERKLWKAFAQTREAYEASQQPAPVIAQAGAFKIWLDRLEQMDDEVLTFTIRLYKYIVQFQVLARSVELGDAVRIEKAFLDWMCDFAATGKIRYKEVSARMAESTYGSDAFTIAFMRINESIRLSKGKNMIALDAMCELVNFFYELLRENKTTQKFIEMTGFLAQLRKSDRLIDELFLTPKKKSTGIDQSTIDNNDVDGSDDEGDEGEESETESVNEIDIEVAPGSNPFGKDLPPPKSSTKPKRRQEQMRLFEYIELILLLEYVPGRKLEEIDLFGPIDQLKTPLVPPKEDEKAEEQSNTVSEPLDSEVPQTEDVDAVESLETDLAPEDEKEQEENDGECNTQGPINLLDLLLDMMGTSEEDEDGDQDPNGEIEADNARNEVGSELVGGTQEPKEGSEKYFNIGSLRIPVVGWNRMLIDKPPRVAGREALKKTDFIKNRQHRRHEDKKAKQRAEFSYNHARESQQGVLDLTFNTVSEDSFIREFHEDVLGRTQGADAERFGEYLVREGGSDLEMEE